MKCRFEGCSQMHCDYRNDVSALPRNGFSWGRRLPRDSKMANIHSPNGRGRHSNGLLE
ncbi:protein of unknown function [Thiomonas sp. Sup16B3]|nr:protein of unknown function [Thiomonas sp. Sup16B3]